VSDKPLPFVVIALAVVLLAVFAYTNLEIVPTTVHQPPSRRVRGNDFFALEKWLSRTGHPVRTLRRGNASRIISALEKTVFVQSTVFDWEGAREPLASWMEGGGILIVSTGPHPGNETELQDFLKGFGIGFVNAVDTVLEEAYAEAAKNGQTGSINGAALEDLPDFFTPFYFSLTKEAEQGAFIIKEGPAMAVRLIRMPVGAGALILFGPPLFMENEYLNREANAQLAWELSGGLTGTENPGLLFIRGKIPVKSLFGRLAERGNFFPLAVSLLILLAVGFWMVVPVFGLVFQEKDSPGRPIRERFLAEIRFLKKYHALGTYLELYLHEIKRKFRGREPPPELKSIEQSLREKGRLSDRQIVRALQILEARMDLPGSPGFQTNPRERL
jgi:hypothetical protein